MEKRKEEKEKEKKKLENEDFTFEKRINCIEDLRQKGIHKACVLLKEEREEKEKEKEMKDYEKSDSVVHSETTRFSAIPPHTT